MAVCFWEYESGKLHRKKISEHTRYYGACTAANAGSVKVKPIPKRKSLSSRMAGMTGYFFANSYWRETRFSVILPSR